MPAKQCSVVHPFELRPFQREALGELAKFKHVLTISPTGSGKSLIYERMALDSSCRMLLVTPLIALARQQESRLKSLGVRVFQGMGGDKKSIPRQYEIGAWIASPESLERSSRRELLLRWRPNFMVVDECHCLWEWGEYFRPAFAQLPKLLSDLKLRRSLWLTATLPPEARKALREQMPDPFIELGEFRLPDHLFLEIVRISRVERVDYFLQRLEGLSGTGIVFVSTRESALRIGRLMTGLAKKVILYHAGLSSEERRAAEKKIASQEVDVVVATSAFGMGMDYAYLRWVILWQPPLSLLSLAQAIGRVGRGRTSETLALVLWDPDEFRSMDWGVSHSVKAMQELDALSQYFHKESCRRAGLENYFNRYSVKRPCQKCDFCKLDSG